MDKKQLKIEAYQQIDMISKNIMVAIANDMVIEYSTEPKEDGTFIIMVTAKHSLKK